VDQTTFIVRDGHLEKLKTIAYWNRKQIKEVVDEALTEYLKDRKVKPVKGR